MRRSDSAGAALDAKSRQYAGEWAEAGEAALEQVQADEGGKKQKALADEQRAGFQAELQGEQDEKSGDNTDNAF